MHLEFLHSYALPRNFLFSQSSLSLFEAYSLRFHLSSLLLHVLHLVLTDYAIFVGLLCFYWIIDLKGSFCDLSLLSLLRMK